MSELADIWVPTPEERHQDALREAYRKAYAKGRAEALEECLALAIKHQEDAPDAIRALKETKG